MRGEKIKAAVCAAFALGTGGAAVYFNSIGFYTTAMVEGAASILSAAGCAYLVYKSRQ